MKLFDWIFPLHGGTASSTALNVMGSQNQHNSRRLDEVESDYQQIRVQIMWVVSEFLAAWIRQDQLINFSRQRTEQGNTVIIENIIVKFLREVHFQQVLNLILPRHDQVRIIRPI